MRKTILGLALWALTSNLNVLAQNTFPASGNVGIGTTNPGYSLDIQGGGLNVNNGGAHFTYNGAADITFAYPGRGVGGRAFVADIGNALTINYAGDFSGGTNIGSSVDVYGQMQSTVFGDVGGAVALYDPSKTTSGTASIWRIYNMTGVYGNSLQFWAYDNVGCTTGGLCNSRLTLMDSGNVGIGTTTPGASLEVHGNVKLSSGSGASITFQDGTVQSTAYTGVTCGGDYAESVDVTGNRTQYEPGDVLVLDTENPGRVLKSVEAYSTTVSGIYSTKPGVVGRRQTIDPKTTKTEVPMAMMGVVPTKVSTENGAIKVGDLLVSSSTAGYAMKGTDRSKMLGAVIGKAMGNLNGGQGVIEVLVTLQ